MCVKIRIDCEVFDKDDNGNYKLICVSNDVKAVLFGGFIRKEILKINFNVVISLTYVMLLF